METILLIFIIVIMLVILLINFTQHKKQKQYTDYLQDKIGVIGK